MMAGIAELDGDAEKVLGYFDNNGFDVVKNFLDPAITDFALEIILRLKADAGRLQLTRAYTEKIKEAQAQLLRRLIDIKRHDLQVDPTGPGRA
jgi:hypothetical protein